MADVIGDDEGWAKVQEQLDATNMDRLVQRFLTWQLPASVVSDLCVTDPNYQYPRSGTNLLTTTEARQMLEHVLGVDP